MSRTKIILSLVGLAAFAVPVALLVIFSSKTTQIPPVSTQSRTIDANKVEDTTKKQVLAPTSPSPSPVFSPSQSTGSAVFEPSPQP